MITFKDNMNAFSPGEENADFGDPELITLFLWADFSGKSMHYAGKKVFGRHFLGGPEFCFPPISFSPGKNALIYAYIYTCMYIYMPIYEPVYT